MLCFSDVEREARAIYADAGADLDDPPGMVRLAEMLLGPGSVVQHNALSRTAAYVSAIGQVWTKPGASGARLSFAIAHELAEARLQRCGLDAEQVEALADKLGAALIVPAPAFRLALRECGRSLPVLAREFLTSQSVISLRLAEVTGNPLALVTPRRIHVAGEAYGWPPEADLRRIARGIVPPQLERMVITDASRRVALAAVA